MRRLRGKSAIVTGASSGVGRAVAVALSAEGVSLGLVARDEVRLEETRKALPAGAHCTTFIAEFCDDSSVALLASTLARTYSSLDLLIHSAGVIKLAPFASASLDDFDAHFHCNVRAPYALTQRLLPALTAAKGTVVFVNSTVVDNARAGISQYAASKHALKAVADNLRQEVNQDGVRVLSIFLGRTATPMQERVSKSEQKRYAPERLIQPDDVASLILTAAQSSQNVELTNIYLRPSQPPL